VITPAARRSGVFIETCSLSVQVKRLCASLVSDPAWHDECGIPAARGGKWSAVQVARLLEAAAIPFGGSQGANVGIA
jgi:hypothetical protein